MPIEIEDWEIESGHYLDLGKKVVNRSSQIKYEISALAIDGITLKKIPYFKNEKDEPLEITFPELEKAFKEEILLIDGFEAAQVRELKIAVNSLIKKLKIAQKDELILDRDNQVKAKSEELEKIKSESESKRIQEEEEKTRKVEATRKKQEEEHEKKRQEEEIQKKAKEEKILQRKQNASEMATKLIEIELTL